MPVVSKEEVIQQFISLMVAKIQEVESPENLLNLWLPYATLKEEVNDETYEGDLFMEEYIIGQIKKMYGQKVPVHGEEHWNIGPEEQLSSGHYFILDPLDGSKQLHKIANGNQVFPGYGVLIAEIKDYEILSSISVGRFGSEYLGFYASEDGFQTSGNVPNFFVEPPHTIVVGNSKKNGAERLNGFAKTSKDLLKRECAFLSENLGSVWANIMGIVFGRHGAYVCTHNAMVYDYAGLAYLFQKMGGVVIDLGAEDGVFRPQYGQQALMFLHPSLPRAWKVFFLSLYIGDERARELLD